LLLSPQCIKDVIGGFKIDEFEDFIVLRENTSDSGSMFIDPAHKVIRNSDIENGIIFISRVLKKWEKVVE
jgi:hypothetical protein